MAEEGTTETGVKGSISWRLAAILAVLALIGGVWLGRVAFVTSDAPTPRIARIEVLDDELEVSGSVEYLDEAEVYLLNIVTMPPPGENQVFQVWVQRDDLVVRAGLLDPNSHTFAYAAYDGRYDTMFVTREPGPFGSEQPTSDPLISVDLTALEEGAG